MYFCVACEKEVQLPDYDEENGDLICPRVECGQKTVEDLWL